MSKSVVANLHRNLMKCLDNLVDKHASKRLQKFWHYNAGPKTIFFWAPLVKWGLVLAGLEDLNRPLDTISYYQPLALACSGAIWSRYSVVIYPINYSLLGVNALIFVLNIYVCTRAYYFHVLLTEEERQLIIKKNKKHS